MAEPEQVLTTDETGERTSITTKKSIWDAPKRRKPRRKSGAERLQWAADKQVGKNSKILANLLMEKALEGNVGSTRVLVGLAERMKPGEKRKNWRAWEKVMALASEPEWVDPPEEEGVGNRE
jgi:hypothetical protein